MTFDMIIEVGILRMHVSSLETISSFETFSHDHVANFSR
jgi:hypothetical protein